MRNPYAEQVFVRAMRDMGWLTGACKYAMAMAIKYCDFEKKNAFKI